jgi:hypothetical protein
MLAFAADQPPSFEDTPALRRLAARELGVSMHRLGQNGPELLDLLLRDVWGEQLLGPDHPNNPTGGLLVDAEYCTQAHRALRIYEDYRRLLGVRTWNPAREVAPLTAPNPAERVLPQYHVDPSQNFNQPIEHDLIVELERAMRYELKQVAGQFTTEEILDGLTAPQQPLVAWTPSLPRLRARLTPYLAECSTDEDLLKAARRPEEPLIASGACRIQVLQRRAGSNAEAFTFQPEDLQRRIEAELWLDEERQEAEQPWLEPVLAG